MVSSNGFLHGEPKFNGFYRLRTTFTAEPIEWEKRKKICHLNFGQVDDAKNKFDDIISEPRQRLNISFCPLNNSYLKVGFLDIVYGFRNRHK